MRYLRALPRAEFALAFAGALLGVLVAALLDSDQSVAPTWMLFVALTTFVGVGAYIALKLDEIKSDLRELGNRRDDDFHLLHPKAISSFASDAIAKATVTRVIGTARQDILDRDSLATSYLRSSERRLTQGPPMYYRRITATRLRPAFAEHLRTLLENSSTHNHDVQIAFAEALAHAISYQVFDQDSVLLIVDAPSAPGVTDNIAAYVSRNKETVAVFSSHFDAAWSKLVAVSTIAEMDAILAIP